MSDSGISTVILTENNITQVPGPLDSSVTPGPYNKFYLSMNADLTGYEVALSKINIYYSWPNVSSVSASAATIQWPTNAGFSTFQWNLTANTNYASISELNNALQNFCILNGLYLINSSAQNVYYLTLTANPNSYGVDLTLFKVPTSLPAGWSQPSNWIGSYPITSITPRIQFKTQFNQLIGFSSSTVFDGNTTQTTYTSTFCPQLSPTSSVLFSCNIVNNRLSLNGSNSVMWTFTTSGAQFGNLLTIEPNNLTWFDVNAASCSNIVCQFFDQNFSPLNVQDPQTTICLLLRKKIIY